MPEEEGDFYLIQRLFKKVPRCMVSLPQLRGKYGSGSAATPAVPFTAPTSLFKILDRPMHLLNPSSVLPCLQDEGTAFARLTSAYFSAAMSFSSPFSHFHDYLALFKSYL